MMEHIKKIGEIVKMHQVMTMNQMMTTTTTTTMTQEVQTQKEKKRIKTVAENHAQMMKRKIQRQI